MFNNKMTLAAWVSLAAISSGLSDTKASNTRGAEDDLIDSRQQKKQRPIDIDISGPDIIFFNHPDKPAATFIDLTNDENFIGKSLQIKVDEQEINNASPLEMHAPKNSLELPNINPIYFNQSVTFENLDFFNEEALPNLEPDFLFDAPPIFSEVPTKSQEESLNETSPEPEEDNIVISYSSNKMIPYKKRFLLIEEKSISPVKARKSSARPPQPAAYPSPSEDLKKRNDFSIRFVNSGSSKEDLLDHRTNDLMAKATKFYEEKKYETVKSTLSKILRQNPKQKEANYLMGLLMGDINLPKYLDEAQSNNYLKTAAIEGHPNAQLHFGYVFYHENNFEKAEEFFKLVLDNNESSNLQKANATFHMGAIYEDKDIIASEAYYISAYKLGSTKAANNIGRLHFEGLNQQKNLLEAKKWFELSMDAGDTESFYNLGLIYLNGGNGIKQDKKRAIQMFEKGANYKDGDCLNMLGAIYEEGNGVRKNKATAKKYYKKALEAGNDLAAENLSYLEK